MKRERQGTHDRRNTMSALFACAELGLPFYDALGADYREPGKAERVTLYQQTRDYTVLIRDAVIADRDEAIKRGAYFIERVFMSEGARGREKYGWRLCSFMSGTAGGHSYSGETFASAEDFWKAMRSISDLTERAKREKPAPKKSITLHGKLWRDRGPGNTYHSVEIMIDGVTVHKSGMCYGGDGQYEETAAEWLEQNGHIPSRRNRVNGGKPVLWRVCEDQGIAYDRVARSVSRKKDL